MNNSTLRNVRSDAPNDTIRKPLGTIMYFGGCFRFKLSIFDKFFDKDSLCDKLINAWKVA